MNAMRLSKDSVAVWLSWLLTGLILLLVCLFSALIVRDYGRENEAARQTIQEKGSVLIRALESGARVGASLFSSMMVAFSGYQTSPSQPFVVRRTRYNHGLGLAL